MEETEFSSTVTLWTGLGVLCNHKMHSLPKMLTGQRWHEGIFFSQCGSNNKGPRQSFMHRRASRSALTWKNVHLSFNVGRQRVYKNQISVLYLLLRLAACVVIESRDWSCHDALALWQVCVLIMLWIAINLKICCPGTCLHHTKEGEWMNHESIDWNWKVNDFSRVQWCFHANASHFQGCHLITAPSPVQNAAACIDVI